MIINTAENMEERLRDEFAYLRNKYPRVAFNHKTWSGEENSGRDYLLATEGYITIPENYNIERIKKYKGFLTHNSKFADLYKGQVNIIVTNGPVDFHNYYRLDDFVSYEDKIDGIVSLNRIYKTNSPGDIVSLREPTFMNIPYPVKHSYGPAPWAGKHYQGKVDANHANHINNLKITNRYKFVLTLEPMYHQMWSFDWVTERMWNAFKSKTIPIYYGCYNIEDKVPSHLFIDLRKFGTDYNSLSKFLASYTKQQYIDQTEKAFEWYEKECKISNTKDFEDLLSQLP